MSQHDFVIDNQTAPAFRTDLNNALQALATLSSGATAPSSTFANMLWYDTANNILKMRAEADDAWINIAYLDQTTDAFRILDDTQVVNTSGTQTGLLGDQATATWETGTGTTESLVSPAKIKAAIDALASADVGAGTAALTAGGIGTYCFAKGVDTNFGSTIAGSSLNPISALYKADNMSFQSGSSNSSSTGSALSGTWRCMGQSDATWILDGNGADVDTIGYGATLWLRIS
jgi:hypothetical protein